MNILDIIKKDYSNVPYFDHNRAVLSAPVRHIFMMSTIEYLKKNNHKKIKLLEIGSWFGASTLTWAQAIDTFFGEQNEIHCVDAWKPFFETSNHESQDYVKEMESLLEKDVVYHIFKHNVKTISNKIKVITHRKFSDDFFKENNETYDLIFIDADHSYDSVLKDIQNAKKFIKDDGIICGDDLNLQLHQVDMNFAELNKSKDFIQDPKTKKNFHPGVTMAVSESFGNVNSWGGYWAIQKSNSCWKNISLAELNFDVPRHFNETQSKMAMSHFKDIEHSIL